MLKDAVPMILAMLVAIISVQALGIGLKGTYQRRLEGGAARASAKSAVKAMEEKMTDTLKKRGPMWPHEELGYQIRDSVVVNKQSQDNKLSEYEVNFMQLSICGELWDRITDSMDIDRLAVGVAAETCIACNNTANSQVMGCKYHVSEPSKKIPSLSYQFHTYTSEDCSSGETATGESYVREIGVCIGESYMYSYHPKVTDASQLGSGVIVMDFQEPTTGSATSCTNPWAYMILGMYRGTCISTFDDEVDDSDDPSGSVTFDCDNNKLSGTRYVDSTNCQGAGTSLSGDLGRCELYSDDDEFEISDDTSGDITYLSGHSSASYCYSLAAKGDGEGEKDPNSLSAGAIVGISLGSVALAGCAGLAIFYGFCVIMRNNKKKGMASQEVETSSVSTNSNPVRAFAPSSNETPVATI